MDERNSEERVESDQPFGEWYAIEIGDHWEVYDCDGERLLILWERPTPAHVGNMEIAYRVGVRHGMSRGEADVQKKMRAALGLPA